ncbi:hypothetical protein QBC34DRAFT_413016 [Podospora aff. communis PSN243]|uniref:Domain of unknown function at the cortex 1 domain-containing protein n=1 Tax=Podospora aff. communis PSN243 TaxID=3040156 RepID=A0AAV9GBJ6_9PEZI|nr:hypothetical protein QBC34DRAFT_413016 [Podospora aff. communis PSN243]
MADQYIIRVTAGPTYNLDDHVEVPVNQPHPLRVSHDHMDIELNVRIRDYRGFPRNSPSHSPYFDLEPHKYNQDQYSIALRFTPKRPAEHKPKELEEDEDERQVEGISAEDLQFGNDFDHPIRDRLPPGFGTAMNIVKWWIDPGLEGDAYADEPYLYGSALSSFNAVHHGPGEHDEEKGGLWFEEGGDEEGMQRRREWGAPEDGKARMKWALRAENKARWVWEYGRTYGVDFFNPYVDFNEFALRLPGFHLPIIRYWDGQGLRYVLRNRSTGQVYLVVLFTLYLREDVNEDGSLKPAALQATARASGGKGEKGEPMKKDDIEVFVKDSDREKAGDVNDDDDVD